MTPQEIKPTYVTFEQAKRLKEKGFDIECKMCVEEGDERPLPFNCGNTIHKNSLHPYYSAPEQWQVVEWLLQTYKIDVDVSANRVLHTEKAKGYIAEIYTPKVCVPNWELGGNHKNREEAYSAAFDYVLNNLI
jgi:hypothetical protein